MNPEFPIFIPSKGRSQSRLTSKAFDKMNIPYKCVIEPQEYDDYVKYIPSNKLLVLPFSNKGLVATRNWIWDYAQNLGVSYFWTFDDNIRCIYRLNRNIKGRVLDGVALKVIEDFATRYATAFISGMQYESFAPTKQISPPFVLNTRVYSNMLIKTNIPYRNEGFYNDDTDLCLRILKDGYCTILFYAFLIDKTTTMKVAGGMTPHYQDDGRLKMAQELQQKHPDVVKITRKWGRWQHQVDYRPFKRNKLIRKRGIIIPDGPNEYGMKLVKRDG
jgi:hypothetical protein